MSLATLPLLWLLATNQPAPVVELVKYPPPRHPFASTTLFFEGNTGSVVVLDRNNIEVTIAPAEYQDLHISRAFNVICVLPQSYGLRAVGAWVDNRYHLIPVSVIDYNDFFRNHVTLEIDTYYFRNRIFGDWHDHKIHIEFFSAE
jgi:hypothetical protein